jgi:hypothetical protein
MTLKTGILGCALAAGLMTFATNNAQAVVINNTLYSPLNIKVTASYVDSKGKIKQMSVSSKDVLKDLGYNKNVSLVVSSSNYDVWAINKDALMTNLSTNEVLTISYSTYVYTYSGKNENKYTESGISHVNFNDGGDNYFYTSGVFTWSDNSGKTDKNGNYNYSMNYSAKALSGYGYFVDLSNEAVPVTGSAAYSGSGKLVY